MTGDLRGDRGRDVGDGPDGDVHPGPWDDPHDHGQHDARTDSSHGAHRGPCDAPSDLVRGDPRGPSSEHVRTDTWGAPSDRVHRDPWGNPSAARTEPWDGPPDDVRHGPWDDPEVRARVAWSIVAEPGDLTAGAVVAALGPQDALAWASWAVGAGPDAAVHRLRGAVPSEDPEAPARWARVLARALPRWAPRFADLEPRRALDAVAAVGGTVLVPGRPGWPDRLAGLGPSAPPLLWLRGDPSTTGALHRSVAVVGARAATPYGEHVARDLGSGLPDRDVTVVSGGAFGIDVAAHRGALLAGGPTVALLAGGVDRPSPAGNRDVLEDVAGSGGALLAESPPGTPPTRARFLQRNRLIAAATGATVVVEAAWRSGALSTAARAADLLRPLGAVPRPVTSMASAGCHRLLRDGLAVCVTGVDDVVELLTGLGGTGADAASDGPAGGGAARARAETPGRADPTARADAANRADRTPRAERTPRADPTDRADSAASRVLDALPARAAVSVGAVARRAGLGEREVLGALGLLELVGRVQRSGAGWRRASAAGPSRAPR